MVTRVVAALAVVVGLTVPLATPAGGAPTVQTVPGTQDLTSVACASPTSCVAVGYDNEPFPFKGVVVVITNGTPGAVQVVPGAQFLNSVACATATTCYAVGESADAQPVVVAVAAGVSGAAQIVPGILRPASLDGVACPTTTFCQAVGKGSGNQGVIVGITNGAPGAPQLVPGSTNLTAVACSSAASCQAVGAGPPCTSDPCGLVPAVTVAITAGAPGAPQDVPTSDALFGVVCTSATTCYGVGNAMTGDALVVPISNGVPGTPQVASGTSELFNIACPNATTCQAVGSTPSSNPQAAIVAIPGGIPGPPQAVRVQSLSGLACPSPTSCLAVGARFASVASVGVVVGFSTTAGPAPQSITFTTTPPAHSTVGSSFTVAASGGGSGNPVTFSAEGSSAGICTVSGATVAFVGAGNCVIDANQAGNANFAAAPQAQLRISVSSITCQVIGIVAGPPKQQRVAVQSSAGLASIGPFQITNGTVRVDTFTVGTTSPVVVTATKDIQNQRTVWQFVATDTLGNSFLCA